MKQNTYHPRRRRKEHSGKTMAQWNEKRKWMKMHLEYYITGTYPPKPDHVNASILSEKKDGTTMLRMVERLQKR